MIRYLPLLVLIATGCSSVQPRVVSAPAADDSLDCALRQATGLGYSVEAAEAGVFFKAERTEDALNVSVLNVSAAQGELRVAGSTEYRSDGGRRPRGASERVGRDAEAIVDGCQGQP